MIRTRTSAQCPLCGASLVLPADVAVGDVLECRACGVCLVLNALSPSLLDIALVEWLSSYHFFSPTRDTLLL